MLLSQTVLIRSQTVLLRCESVLIRSQIAFILLPLRLFRSPIHVEQALLRFCTGLLPERCSQYRHLISLFPCEELENVHCISLL